MYVQMLQADNIAMPFSKTIEHGDRHGDKQRQVTYLWSIKTGQREQMAIPISGCATQRSSRLEGVRIALKWVFLNPWVRARKGANNSSARPNPVGSSSHATFKPVLCKC